MSGVLVVVGSDGSKKLLIWGASIFFSDSVIGIFSSELTMIFRLGVVIGPVLGAAISTMSESCLI